MLDVITHPTFLNKNMTKPNVSRPSNQHIVIVNMFLELMTTHEFFYHCEFN